MKLLVVSDSPALFSGQARVVRELAGRFHSDGNQVAVAGWFHDVARPDRKADLPYPVVNYPKGDFKPLQVIVQGFQPDVVLCFGDPWDFQAPASLRASGGKFLLAGYLNVEGGPVPWGWEQILDAFDVLLTTSEYGAAVLASARRQAIAVHLGVDRRVFRPVPPQPELNGQSLAEKFFVLINAQNTNRKNIPTALEGFARFAASHPEALCYVNAHARPSGGVEPWGHDLVQLASDLGIEDRVLFNPANRGPADVMADDAMNSLYNTADCLLVTSMNEGFCLPLLEAMATRCVPIAPSAYSARELLAEGRGITIPVAATLRGSRGLEVAVVTAEGVEGCLTSAHAMKTGKAVRLVGNAGYDWDATRDASLKFAIQRSWERCYNLVSDAISAPAPARPGGLKIRPELRATARRVAGRRREAIGVLKLGGLGDMLQTTCVVRAAAQKYGRDVVVFCNSHPEVFRDMSEVSEVVVIPSMPQDEACRSLQREFDLFMDVRYVSCLYGDKPVAFAERHRWFYEHWTDSCGRIESLGLHATEIMLKSLDLPIEDVQPIWATPIGTRPIAEHYLALASGAGAMGRLKRWPDRYWREVAERLHTREIPLLQVGGSEDPTIPWCRDYRGLGVADTATILHHARGLIAPEGGMVHLAAAFRTPSIVIFGPTPRRAFAYPWNIALGDFQCPPCFQATPKWAEGACALGEPHCVNFPSAEDVVSLTYRMVPQ